jgi:hypothetical protein
VVLPFSGVNHDSMSLGRFLFLKERARKMTEARQTSPGLHAASKSRPPPSVASFSTASTTSQEAEEVKNNRGPGGPSSGRMKRPNSDFAMV